MKNSESHKEHIKAKAKDLFFRHGPKHVSIADIAEASSISRKTFYQCFVDKDAIVLEIVNDLVFVHSQLFENSRSTSLDAIEEVLKQDAGMLSVCQSLRPSFFYELEIYYPDIWIQLEQYKLKIHTGILDNLKRGQAEGLYRQDLNADLISDLRHQQLINLLKPEVLTSLDLAMKELVDTFTLIYLRSIGTDKGRNQLQEYITTLN
ncbi:MAG: TetR/AcrR family transcriptional regulator [Chitinophagaceae bacterium]